MADPPLTITRRAEALIPAEWAEFQIVLYEDNRKKRAPGPD